MERALSGDATLDAVTGLFAQPARRGRPIVRQRRRVRRSRGGSGGRYRPILRESRVVLTLAITAIAGLVCVLVAAPINHPVVAAVGVTAAILAGVIFVVTAIRLGATDEQLVPLLARRRTRRGPLTSKEN